ncbi:hypothetical protein DFH09DRAFT_1021879 [Mycena vulgaris]|nr:hypothetical protein DFH09DRAFT_1021879 [Mycena vulgaris]
MEVIDLTAESPPRKDNAEADEARRTRRERRREQRQAKEEEEAERDAKERGEGKRKREERDSRRSERGEEDGKRRRESSADRDPDRKRSRRRRKDRDRDRDRQPSPPIPDDQLFFIDAAPAPLPSAALYSATAPASEKPIDLILPAHVSVFGETPIDIPATALDSDEDDYIEYLDYDNRKDFVRYYDEEPEERRTKIVCKKCGAEGEHTTPQCTVLICMTCGARDEHPTRNCNIGKTCFTCGMKGHINIDCPNRYASKTWHMDGCGRCASSSHQTSECPMLWRLYVYLEDAEQEHVLQARKEKKGMPLGQGGEGYIAGDEWCYNCGGSGHWGDDCREFYHPDSLTEPTAFSYHVLSAGPFIPPATSSHAPREWERGADLPGGVQNVGRQAKRKEMEKLARRARQQEADEPENWFQNPRNVKNRGAPERERERPPGNAPTGPRKMNFAPSVKDGARPFQFTAGSSSKASLSDRLTDPMPERHRDAKSQSGNSKSRRASEREREREQHASDSHSRHRNDRDKERHRDERGPRYKGGYSR